MTSPGKDDPLNSSGSSSIQSENSLISTQQDLSYKQGQNISPRLHQLVRVGPDGRPEVVGRIGNTRNLYRMTE